MIEDDKKNINTEEENTESTNQEVSDDNVVSDESLNKDVESKVETNVEEGSQSDANVESNNDVSINEDSKESKDNKNKSDNLHLPFILGKKIGMTQLFSDNGAVFPATILECGPCYVTQIKSKDTDGYDSLQLGFVDKKESKTSSPLNGHFKKSGVSPKRFLKEFRYSNIDNDFLGKEVLVSQFVEGDFVTITGTSKGKGFAGHMKRHNFGGGRRSHGKNSVMRKAGSIGAGTSPGRVWKGTRMAGRMGNDTVTVKNLEIIKINSEQNMIFIKGSVPGANNNILYIKKSNYEG